ncbi:MAG: TolC family protein [Planctomycetota bacterium]|jgi:outer membrane protein TolC
MPLLLVSLVLVLTGCRSPSEYRREADRVASDIVTEKQKEALGRTEPFDIERPSDILRHRLLEGQNLAYAGQASLGADRLEPVEHWPEEDYPRAISSDDDPNIPIDPNEPRPVPDRRDEPIKLSLVQALQVGARNSPAYQSRKEDVFRAALDLDLERNEFRNIFTGQVTSLISTDASGSSTVSGTENSADVGLSRTLQSGVGLSTALAVDLANLLTGGGASSLGLAADATISIPLLRGSGKHIVTEPLTQAERDVVYAIYDFERFKRTFAVNVARGYLGVLQQEDEVTNQEENYRSLIASARRSRRLADAGRLSEIQVDQAVQSELRARNSWISTKEQYKNRLDAFKSTIGLPPDALIKVDPNDLEQLRVPASKLIEEIVGQEDSEEAQETPPADALIELVPVSGEGAGPLELDESTAVRLALDNRLDLRTALGEVYDAQRQVIVRADALRAELTLLGSADAGARRSVASATRDDAELRFDQGRYSALLTLDLPLERTAERNAYRDSFINLERAVRSVQTLEDQIKLSVRGELRDLLESRESLKIQSRSVVVAQKRVKSTNLFLEAGRAQIRDLLEAQESLLGAQNSLTRAVISYRIAELELQQDMGLLQVDESGMWREFSPEVNNNVEQ